VTPFGCHTDAVVSIVASEKVAGHCAGVMVTGATGDVQVELHKNSTWVTFLRLVVLVGVGLPITADTWNLHESGTFSAIVAHTLHVGFKVGM